MIGRREEQIVATHNGRHVYADERSCHNCLYESTCVEDPDYLFVLPGMFSLKDTWNGDRMKLYMKVILGGMCGHYLNRHSHIRLRDLQRKADKGELDYDL